MQRTILLVDDEENIISSLVRVLRRDGYNIIKAHSGEDGLARLLENDVGVVISDHRMPQMTGVEFLSKVKELLPNTVRIMLSGYSDLQAVTDAINKGAIYKFLSKPWDDDLLRANVAEAFERYELKQENVRLAGELKRANDVLAQINQGLEKQVDQQTREGLISLQALHAAQEVFDKMPVAVIGIAKDGVITVANQMAHECCRYLQGVMIGSHISKAFPDELIDIVQSILDSGEISHRDELVIESRIFDVYSSRLGGAEDIRGQILVLVEDARLTLTGHGKAQKAT